MLINQFDSIMNILPSSIVNQDLNLIYFPIGSLQLCFKCSRACFFSWFWLSLNPFLIWIDVNCKFEIFRFQLQYEIEMEFSIVYSPSWMSFHLS